MHSRARLIIDSNHKYTNCTHTINQLFYLSAHKIKSPNKHKLSLWISIFIFIVIWINSMHKRWLKCSLVFLLFFRSEFLLKHCGNQNDLCVSETKESSVDFQFSSHKKDEEGSKQSTRSWCTWSRRVKLWRANWSGSCQKVLSHLLLFPENHPHDWYQRIYALLCQWSEM